MKLQFPCDPDFAGLISSETFSAVLENSPSFIALVQANGRIISLNQPGCALVGFKSADDAIRRELNEITELTSRNWWTDQVGEEATRNNRWIGETKFQNLADGTEIPVQVSAFAVKDSSGKAIYFVLIARDLRDEKKLMSRLSILQKAIDSSNEGIVISELKGKDAPVIYVNAAFTKITGYTLEEAYGRDCRFLQGDPNQPNLVRVRSAIKNQAPIRALLKNQKKDGKEFWNELSLAPVKDEFGSTTHYIGVQRDVSQERMTKDKLFQETQRMQLVLSTIEFAIFEWDLVTKKVIWDGQMYHLHRVRRSEFPDPVPGLVARLHPEDRERIRTLTKDVIAGKTVPSTTYRILTDEREVRHIRIQARSVRDKDGRTTQLIGVAWDVTQEMRAQETIKEQQAKIESSARLAALGEMAGGVAHEINNPLAIISAYMDRLRESAVIGTVDQEELLFCVNKVTHTISRITGIIKGLRRVSRDGTDDPFEPTTTGAMIRDSLAVFSEKARSAGIKLEIGGDLETPLDCRVVQISQVITNLVSNAIHAVQSVPVRWVKLMVEEKDSEIFIRVSDSGPGVPAHLREKIFQPFFTTKEVGKGTGLGLSISTSVVRDHRGELSYDATAPHSCFVVRLPKNQPTNKAKAA